MQLQLMIQSWMHNFLKSGAVLGPAPYRTHPMCGATISESLAPYLVRLHMERVPCTAPRFQKVRRRTWSGSILDPDHVRRQQSWE